MEKQLNCILLLPLEQIALRKVVVMFWKQIDILTLFEISTYFFIDRDIHLSRRQTEGESIIKSRLLKLGLPELLLKKAMCLLKPVGLEIIEWIKFHSEFLIDPYPLPPGFLHMEDMKCVSNLDRRVLKKLCFTSLGTVDCRKTAEELLCHDMLHIVLGYKLACYYCLDAHISRLWENLSEESKKRFYDQNQWHSLKLEICFPYILKGEEEELKSLFLNPVPFNQRAFISSADQKNAAATRYFYQKLTLEERESLLFKTARRNMSTLFGDFPATLRYLLMQMSHEQQMELLREFPTAFLSCFLQWPWLNIFLDIVELTWDFLPLASFYTLLCHLYKKIVILGCSNLDLFREFFVRSRSTHKSYFIDKECTRGVLFEKIFSVDDTETFKFIFSNIEAADKARLVVSNGGKQVCHELVLYDKWHSLELFIREATLSKDDRGRLKEDLRQYMRVRMRSRISKMKRLFELLNEPYKRSLEGEKDSETKKPCSEK